VCRLNVWISATEALQLTHTHCSFPTSSFPKLKPSQSSDVSRLCVTVPSFLFSFHYCQSVDHFSQSCSWQQRIMVGKGVWGRACMCVRACTRIWATKPCAKLRAVPRFPPEAELRLSSLFSGSGFRLWEERDGGQLCLCCGSSNPTVYWEPVENNAKEKGDICQI